MPAREDSAPNVAGLGRSPFPRRSERAPSPRVRLLVLPLTNQSADPSQEYFSDAVTEEIITELTGVAPEQLAVVARTTAMHYKGRRSDLTRIGRELGVDYVVGGDVRRTSLQVQINVQLARVGHETLLWAKRYEVDPGGVFDAERAIALAVAFHVGAISGEQGHSKERAGRHTRRKPTQDLVAYNEYIQGRHQMASYTSESLAKARQHIERAVARDPEFALAYDSLAEIHWHLGYFGFARPRDVFSAGVSYAQRALTIDNALAETHALLGQYHNQLDYSWPEVQAEMDRARELDPASAIVRVRYAVNGLMPHGRLEEAVAELEGVLDTDPLSVYALMPLAIMLVLWRRYDRALDQSRLLLEIDPTAYWGHLVIGSCHREQQRYDEAIAAHQRAVELSGGSAAMLGWLGLALGLGGRTVEARALLERLHAMEATAYVPPTSFAWIHLGLGEIESAFDWMDRAIDGCDQLMMPIKSYAFFDPIRADPRFTALLRKMHLDA